MQTDQIPTLGQPTVKIVEEEIAKKEAEKAAFARVVRAVVSVGRDVAATAEKKKLLLRKSRLKKPLLRKDRHRNSVAPSAAIVLIF